MTPNDATNDATSAATEDAAAFDAASLEEALEATEDARHGPVDLDPGVVKATPPSGRGLAVAGAVALLTTLAIIGICALYATRGG